MLKELRKKAGYKQKELAKACGVGRSTISNIELGANLPSVKLAKKIGEVLKIDWTVLYE